MARSGSYSPLEALLLFQHLSIHGLTGTVFSKISELLQSDPQIRGGSGYDAGRLSPDALRDFFQRLLKEEAKSELEAAGAADNNIDNNNKNNNEAQPSRKRKAPSPSLPSIQDALEDTHLLPRLIVKLYSRYREDAVAEIRKDEKRHETLWQEIHAIRDGVKQNGQVKNQQTATQGSTASHLPSEHRNSPHGSDASRVHQSATASSQSSQIAGEGTGSKLSPPAMAPPPTPGVPAQSAATASGAANHTHSPYASTRSQHTATPGSPGSHIGPFAGNSRNVPYQQQPYTNSPYPSHRGGGVMLQPFQVAPQVPSPMQQQAQQQQQSQPPSLPHSPPAPSTPIPKQSQSPRPSNASKPPLPIIADIAKLLSDPTLSASKFKSQPSTARNTQTSWKSTSFENEASAEPSSPTHPRSRSVSPISVKEPSPEATASRSRRSRRNQEPSVHQTRSSRNQSKRKRGGSTTSSAVGSSSVRGRTRSQSVLSQAEDSYLDAESLGRKVKNEPSTPAATSDLVASTTADDTPMPTSTMTTRRTAHAPGRNKRKRSVRDTSEASDSIPPVREKNFVMAVRNFPRLSMTIMNDVLSHKHASLFSNPVRDRDAEGYSGMIRRPTDLKTIKTAIAAGARAVNSATADLTPTAAQSPRDSSGTVMLPLSEDLMPPKGIVNSAQLEKELMRMFANAVMFNPGEEDVVQDAREMFESATVYMANFRSAEREADAGRRRPDESEADDNLAVDDESTPVAPSTTPGKRRKLA